MTPLKRASRRTFVSLHESPNFRRYFVGQAVSGIGTWMQSLGQAWLVLRLTNDPLALGITLALQFAPILALGAWAGVLADRFDKRKVLSVTASAAGALGLALGLVTLTGAVEVWMVYGLALVFGVVMAVDIPTRRAFIPELVSRDNQANAVSLNSALFTGARIVGPAIAGFVIAGVGVAWCFILNGVSYAAVIVSIAGLRVSELRRTDPVARRRGQVREGLRYAWHQRDVRIALLSVAIVSTLAINYQVIVPFLVRDEFGRGGIELGLLMAVIGLGGLAGALFAAHHGRANRRLMLGACAVFGLAGIGVAVVPTLGAEALLMLVLGASMMVFMTMTTAVCNEFTPPELQGRVMALWSVAFLGSNPIGAPLVGWISDVASPRAAFAVGGVVALLTAAWAYLSLHKRRSLDRPITVEVAGVDVAAA